MICPYCNAEMEEGCVSTDASVIAWRKEKYESALVNKGNGIQLAKNIFPAAASIENAHCCKHCEKIIIDYSKNENTSG